jgi:hypothetical protein
LVFCYKRNDATCVRNAWNNWCLIFFFTSLNKMLLLCRLIPCLEQVYLAYLLLEMWQLSLSR